MARVIILLSARHNICYIGTCSTQYNNIKYYYFSSFSTATATIRSFSYGRRRRRRRRIINKPLSALPL